MPYTFSFQENEMGGKRDSIIHLILPGTDLTLAPRIVKDSMKKHLCIHMRNYDDAMALERLVCALQGKKPVLSSRFGTLFSDMKRKLFRSGSSHDSDRPGCNHGTVGSDAGDRESDTSDVESDSSSIVILKI